MEEGDPVVPGEPKSGSGVTINELEDLRADFVRGLEQVKHATQAIHSSQRRGPSVVRVFLEPAIATAVAVLFAIVSGLLPVELPLPLPANMPAQPLPANAIPRPSPFAGAFEPTRLISGTNTRRIFEGLIQGPEHVIVDAAGSLWTAAENGTVYSARQTRGKDGALAFGPLKEETYIGPARPLGLAMDASGDGLYLCNSVQGLMHWKKGSTQATVVANRVSKTSARRAGSLVTFANSVAVASKSSKVYFTSSTDIPPPFNRKGTYATMRAAFLTIISGSMTGMLHEYDEATGETRCLLEGMWFSNGVALSADEDFVVVVDTGLLHVLRHWVAGPQAGKTEVLIDALPAYPDNLNRLEDGTFWLGFAGGVAPISTKGWIFKNKFARTLMAHLPAWARPKEKAIGGGIQFDRNGKVIEVVIEPAGKVITSTPSGTLLDSRWLVMGNLMNDYIAITDISTP